MNYSLIALFVVLSTSLEGPKNGKKSAQVYLEHPSTHGMSAPVYPKHPSTRHLSDSINGRIEGNILN